MLAIFILESWSESTLGELQYIKIWKKNGQHFADGFLKCFLLN